MDGRGRVTARNWDFSQHGTSNSVPNTISLGYHETSLKMNSHNNESNFPSLDFQQWIPQRSFLSTNPQNPIISSSSSAQQVESQENVKKKKGKNIASKALKTKEPKKKEKKGDTTTNNAIGVKHKRNQNEFSEDLDIDLSSVPAPICSCTGITRQCYRWGSGGWQSSCCTRRISEYPLPISESRPGARLSGRKMSVGAFKKVLHKLSLEGRDLACPVDLKDHWARHGTNKFVTIR